MLDDLNLEYWLIGWVLAATFVVLRHWRSTTTAGLLMTYVLSFGTLHVMAPALALLPWYDFPAVELTATGLRESVIAMIAFAAGAEITAFLKRRHEPSHAGEWVTRHVLSGQMITIYLLVALFMYGIVAPLAGRLPTVGAVASTGSTLLAVAVALKAWNARMTNRNGQALLWMASTIAFPLMTVIAQGFLGYGFAATLIVFSLVASFSRPGWKTVVATILLAYAGLSVYVTYMRDRGDIRSVVWGGATFEERWDQLYTTIRTTEWFDVKSQAHLDRVRGRLDQDFLVGAAAAYLEDGNVEFAYGSTIVAAAVAIVPRALWPDKPVVAGSGDIVTTYTGIRFADGTSVGVGQVLELYINFGTAGVIGGFLIIGLLVTYIDRTAATHLTDGHADRFLLWYLPGLSLLQIGGALSEVVATAGASFVLVQIVNRVAAHMAGRHHEPDADGEASSEALAPRGDELAP
jgi:hypothetical protein